MPGSTSSASFFARTSAFTVLGYVLAHALSAQSPTQRTQSSRAYSTRTGSSPPAAELSHVCSTTNTPQMVDVSAKQTTVRTAVAQSVIRLPPHVMAQLLGPDDDGQRSPEIFSKKGPVFSTAIIAGTLAAKKTADLIPFCHPIPIENCKIAAEIGEEPNTIVVRCTVVTSGKTGVEMEALVGCSLASLTIYDMLKALSHSIVIETTQLIQKTGGKSDIDLGP